MAIGPTLPLIMLSLSYINCTGRYSSRAAAVASAIDSVLRGNLTMAIVCVCHVCQDLPDDGRVMQ